MKPNPLKRMLSIQNIDSAIKWFVNLKLLISTKILLFLTLKRRHNCMTIIYFEKISLSLTEASIKKQDYIIFPSPEIKSKIWLRVEKNIQARIRCTDQSRTSFVGS